MKGLRVYAAGPGGTLFSRNLGGIGLGATPEHCEKGAGPTCGGGDKGIGTIVLRDGSGIFRFQSFSNGIGTFVLSNPGAVSFLIKKALQKVMI